MLSPSEAAVCEALLAFVASDGPDSIGVLDLLMELGERFEVPLNESFAIPNFGSIDALPRPIDDRLIAV